MPSNTVWVRKTFNVCGEVGVRMPEVRQVRAPDTGIHFVLHYHKPLNVGLDSFHTYGEVEVKIQEWHVIVHSPIKDGFLKVQCPDRGCHV